MGGEMRGEFVERLLDLQVIAKVRTRAQSFEPGGALRIVGEEAMDIGAHDAPVGRNRAVEASVGETHERPRAARAARPADVHFITVEWRAIVETDSVRPREDLLSRHDGGDFEQAEPGDFACRTFRALRVSESRAQ